MPYLHVDSILNAHYSATLTWSNGQDARLLLGRCKLVYSFKSVKYFENNKNNWKSVDVDWDGPLKGLTWLSTQNKASKFCKINSL